MSDYSNWLGQFIWLEKTDELISESKGFVVHVLSVYLDSVKIVFLIVKFYTKLKERNLEVNGQ